MTAKVDMARKEACLQYAAAFEAWGEQEQLMALDSRHIEAEGAHQYARMVLRAWIAEQDDPEPKEHE